MTNLSLFSTLAVIIAFGVTALLGIVMIPWLRKIKFGQTIREDGPTWHLSKQGTPTMGGMMFIIGTVSAVSICFSLFAAIEGGETMLSIVKVVAGIGMALCMGIVGFMDDFISIKKKRNLGLTEKQKLILQFLIAGAYLLSVYLAGGTSKTLIPFVGEVDLGIFYYILALLFIVGMVNAVNFADGIDGLNSTVTCVNCLIMTVCAVIMGYYGMSIYASAAAGACIGFLVWNFHPAKVFMGDTGSLFLGGVVCALAFGMNIPVMLLLIGIVYIIEILSVVLQVSYFKITHGKRIFKMSPIHHHFEMCGWSEVKICVVFSLVSAVMGAIAILLIYFGL
ncbi:MAG: phospho-N-acetylmuramoyl-pentapeptide-transferase [Clostridia bacterium]|nr:phospho-N-acetylmuramoyl-pentapeptide-transferase [Clostridia bacterium]